MPYAGTSEEATLADARLRRLVLEELSWEPSVASAHLEITARGGVVTLGGHVESYAETQAADAAARRVKGVRAVAEEIEVRLPFAARRGDGEIAAAAASKLRLNSLLPAGVVTVAVAGGWLTLSGELEWNFQRDAALREVGSLWGVAGVTNAILISPRDDVGALGADITRALYRACSDPGGIKVTAIAGRVRLTGAVPSWNDRTLATRIAWAAPGATAVENDLVIG